MCKTVIPLPCQIRQKTHTHAHTRIRTHTHVLLHKYPDPLLSCLVCYTMNKYNVVSDIAVCKLHVSSWRLASNAVQCISMFCIQEVKFICCNMGKYQIISDEFTRLFKICISTRGFLLWRKYFNAAVVLYSIKTLIH